MVKFFKFTRKLLSTPPGTLVHSEDNGTESHKFAETKIKVLVYDENLFQETDSKEISENLLKLDKQTVTWIKIEGIHDIDLIQQLGRLFNLHPLLLEDILNPGQRPKMDDYNDYVYLTLKLLDLNQETNELNIEQISLILGSNYVISFQETNNPLFNPILERIRSAKGRLKRMGSDYLAYVLVDILVDNYFPIMEDFGEKIEELEDELVLNPMPKTLHAIHNLKRNLIFLRKSIWPLRELLNGMERRESPLISENILVFLRDVYDHTIQIIETVESYRDMVSAMLDIYLTSISNKMNEIMKVLTIIATIFIPLTFIVGIYGMNFKIMPELDWVFGYPFILIAMLVIGIFMLWYFKTKKWI